jgi:hypothetical protein
MLDWLKPCRPNTVIAADTIRSRVRLPRCVLACEHLAAGCQ